jgi:HlyD family secretion protein
MKLSAHKIIAIYCIAMFFITGCRDENKKNLQGYIEGEFVYISAESSARISKVMVTRGQDVSAGQALIVLDDDYEKKQVEIAHQTHAGEAFTLADLGKGGRTTELNILKAQLSQARHDAEASRSKLGRFKKLHPNGYVSELELEQIRAENKMKWDKVQELTSQLKNKSLPSRSDQIDAQKAKVEGSLLQVEQSKIALNKRILRSAGTAKVYDIMYHSGEVASPGSPLISLLPENTIKIRFFVRNPELYKITQGMPISVKIEGRDKPMAAKVTYISPKAEFTPPVMFTATHTERMVFMIEAMPAEPGEKLYPGQPVEVIL